MAMGDPNWVSLLPGPPAENAIEAGNKGVLAGLQIGQAKAVRGALQNLDINSPASTNDAVGALVRAGALDQATGLMNLNFTRDLRSRVGPLMDKLSGLGGQQAPAPATTASPPAASPNGDTMTPDQLQHVTDTMGQGVDALKQIRALPPEQRAAAFQQARQAFVDRGIPPQAVDAAGRDLSDAGLDQQIAYLSAHGDHFGAQAQGQASTAPTMAHPSQYAWASTLLSDPSMQLGLAMAKAAGIDLSGLTDTAKALVAPEIAKQAEAAHAQEIAQGSTAGTNLANTNPATAPAPFKGGVHGTLPNGQPGWVMGTGAAEGQTAEANAGALGAAAGQNGGQTLFDASGAPHVVPVQGAGPTAAGYKGQVARAEAAGSAAGGAPAHLQRVTLPDGSTQEGTFVAGPNGSYVFQPVQGTGGGAGLGHAPSPQQAQMYDDSAKQWTADRATSGQLQTQLVPLRTAYDLVNSGKVRLGPGSETWNRVQSFVTNTLHLDQSAVANYDEVHKYLVQIANQRATQFGAGTNEKLAVAASGSPNVDMSSLGAAQVLRVNIALARADAAKAASYNGPPEGYGAYASNYGRTTDPRAFMLDMMSPAEKKALFASVKREGPAAQAHFANGLIAAKAAGY